MKLLKQSSLTEKQKNTLAYIFNCGKRVKQKLDNSIYSTDEEKARLKNMYDRYKKEFINVYTAKERYDEHIRMADYHITEAEKIKKELEF